MPFFQEGGVAPTIIRRNPVIGSGQVTRKVGASNRFAALAAAERDTMPDMDDAVATQPVQVPLPTWVDDVSQGSTHVNVVGCSSSASHQEFVVTDTAGRFNPMMITSVEVHHPQLQLHLVPGSSVWRISESDTESVPGIDRRTRRRLSLQRRADPDAIVPDSHDRRFIRVRRAMQLERQQEQFSEFAADPQPLGPICPRRGWEPLDMVDLQAEFRCRVRCLQAVPSFLRGQFRRHWSPI